jgi:hypothetical protein
MPTTATLDIGDRPVITVTFRTADGTLTTPTTTTFITRDPAGTETTYATPNAAISTVSTGTLAFTFPSGLLTTAGVWWVRAKGTGSIEAATELAIQVTASAFTTP